MSGEADDVIDGAAIGEAVKDLSQSVTDRSVFERVSHEVGKDFQPTSGRES